MNYRTDAAHGYPATKRQSGAWLGWLLVAMTALYTVAALWLMWPDAVSYAPETSLRPVARP